MHGIFPEHRSYGFLWEADLTPADPIFRQGLTSLIITAKHAALAMMPAKGGLIVEVTENDRRRRESHVRQNGPEGAAAPVGR